ncbi:hypothetical protein V5O48_015418 [Marasmius crinis-equi]|uniref:Uncharacterized protein n=1 Tax=Marasmius crinis-equi TaxID=585013 RepID=A0ABR3EUM1_9AGAR
MPSIASLDNVYALLDPNVLVGTENQLAIVQSMTTTMKLQMLLHYQLQSPTFQLLKTKEWKSIVGTEIHPTKADIRTGEQHVSMSQILKKCLVFRKIEAIFDLEKPGSILVEWMGKEYDQRTMLSKNDIQEAL